MEKDEIIKVLTQIFDNTKHIHPKSDWVKIAIHKSADYLTRKFSKPKEDKERKEIMKRYGIWEYFNEQHNLQLLESEVDEVVSLALKDNYVKKEIKTAGEIKHKINQIICRYHQDNDYKTDKATEDLFELINVSQFQEQPITVTDEDEKAITEFDLTDLFDDLEKNAYNAEYHNYNYKQANQIIRKHFEALSLKAQKPSDEDIWNAAKEYAEENSRAFYTENYKAFRDGATECRDNNIYISPDNKIPVSGKDDK